MYFLSALHYCIDLYVPVKNTYAFNCHKKRYTKHIRNLLNIKLQCWKRYSGRKTYSNKQNYKRATSACSLAIKQYHSYNESRLINNGSIGNFYKFVNSKLKTVNDVPPLMRPSGELCFDNIEKAELLSNYFSSMFSIDNHSLPPCAAVDNVQFPFESLLCFPDTVAAAIRKMKNCKSVGSDRLPVLLLKNLCSYLAVPLSLIFNVSLSTGKIPTD